MSGLPQSAPASMCTLDWGKLRLPPFQAGDDFQPAWSLYDAIRTLDSVAAGLLCQPRFFQLDESRFNAAGRCLESLSEALMIAADQIATQARTAGGTAREDHYRARILWQDAAGSVDGLGEFVELARELSNA